MNFIFAFRNGTYKAWALFSFDEEPYFLSTTLLDTNLISEFGETLSIKTDGDKVLQYPGEADTVFELKAAVFNYLKETLAFKQLKANSSF